MRKYLPPARASQKPPRRSSATTAWKYAEFLLIILPACANIGRATDCSFCQTREMALSEPNISIVNPPSAGSSPDERTSRSVSAGRADMMTKPAPERLVVDAQNISLTFETADGKVEALSNVSLRVAPG